MPGIRDPSMLHPLASLFMILERQQRVPVLQKVAPMLLGMLQRLMSLIRKIQLLHFLIQEDALGQPK